MDDCTEECDFGLQITIELCKANGTDDEESLRDCLENHFSLDFVNNRF